MKYKVYGTNQDKFCNLLHDVQEFISEINKKKEEIVFVNYAGATKELHNNENPYHPYDFDVLNSGIIIITKTKA